MSLNNVTLQGRIPFDIELKGAEGKEYMRFMISPTRDYKPEGEQYYKEDLIPVKAFGAKAKFISTYFKKGDHMTIVGELRKDDDYMVGEEKKYGELYVNAEKVYFAPKSNDSGEKASGESKPASKAAPKPVGKSAPVFGAATKSPFGKK